MKTQIIHFGGNSDLPQSVRDSMPDDGVQTVFRTALNSHLQSGHSEMHSYVKAYRQMQDLGYERDAGGKWGVKKESPTISDVHVDAPIGTRRKPKVKDDPGTDLPDVDEFEEIAPVVKVFVPPVEVQAAAKSAWAAGVAISDVTSGLAGVGLELEAVRKIAAHFSTAESRDEKGHELEAWGGYHAAKWAARVIRKFGEVDKGGLRRMSNMKRSIAHAGCCDVCKACEDQGWIPEDEAFESGEGEAPHHPNCQCDTQTELRRTQKSDDLVDVQLEGEICKVDEEQHLVFGWGSIVTVGGKPVTDTQDDQITPQTIEVSAYDFALNSRIGGEMHEGDKVAQLVESMVFTGEKIQSLVKSLRDQNIPAVIDLGCVGWWVGFKVTDQATWDRVKSGELKAFSVGGRGKRAAVAA